MYFSGSYMIGTYSIYFKGYVFFVSLPSMKVLCSIRDGLAVLIRMNLTNQFQSEYCKMEKSEWDALIYNLVYWLYYNLLLRVMLEYLMWQRSSFTLEITS